MVRQMVVLRVSLDFGVVGQGQQRSVYFFALGVLERQNMTQQQCDDSVRRFQPEVSARNLDACNVSIFAQCLDMDG